MLFCRMSLRFSSRVRRFGLLLQFLGLGHRHADQRQVVLSVRHGSKVSVRKAMAQKTRAGLPGSRASSPVATDSRPPCRVAAAATLAAAKADRGEPSACAGPTAGAVLPAQP